MSVEVSVAESEYKAAWVELNRKLADLSPVLNEIGEIIVSSIRRNFREGGRFGTEDEFGGGSQKWQKSNRAKQQQGQTLLDTGRLAASIIYRVQDNSLVVGSNLAYAAIHQFGGNAGRGGKVHLAARPYMVIQNKDIEAIQQTIIDHYSNLL